MGVPLPLALSKLKFSRSGSRVTMGRNVISFPPDVQSQRPIERPRSRVVDDAVTYQTEASQSQFEAASLFYKTTLGSGTLEFDMVDPDLNQIATFKFVSGPTYDFSGGAHRKMTWNLIRWGN